MTEKEKESKDKKIREAILNGLIDCRDAPNLGWSNFGGIHIDDCITWLEKQDKKSTDKWISVEDDLPCNNPNNIHFGFTNNVLVIDDNKNISIAFMKKYKDNEWIWDSTNNFVFLPLITHWMQIPKLPKE